GEVGLCQLNDGQGGSCPRADAVPVPGDTWKLVRLDGTTTRCQFSRVTPNPVSFPEGDCSASISWGGPGQPEYITIDDTNTDYRFGTLRIRQGITQKQSGDFHVSLDIPIEEYLLGLREVPLSWNPATLQTQVVTGRTYALEKFARYYDPGSTALNGYLTVEGAIPYRMSACACHVYDSTFDQNYRGMDNEQKDPSTYDDWAAAVSATAGDVVTHQGLLIQAFYSSSTGGNTENSENVFSSPLPYAKSVPDPWSVTLANPNATWTKTVPIETVRKAINFGTSFDTITDIQLQNPAPNALMTVTGTKDGVVKVMSDVSIGKRYGKLGLLSPSVAALTYNPDGAASPYAFTDISESVHWKDINEIAERGITLGCNPPANTLFCPAREVTRGQMAAFLTRTLGLVERAPNPFSDDDGHLFEADIERLAAAGITLGCNPPANDRFCPDRPVTRAQMAAFLSRAYDLVDQASNPFVDDDGLIFEADIERLAAAGITIGCNPPTNDRFCPNNTVLRQQMASFLIRAINYSGG
ncbi:MAG: SpoIID/LytB domain-containing protein, partial [Acidimicrobiia bacterium]|nr:SpoIID/LytB domain-containing protein [Acidimicrobiia bacterium]